MPPKNEQDQIVQYIKAQEEKINRFIEKKLRFIELLKEQRQGVINEAITKGGLNWKTYRLKTIVGSSTNGVWGDEPKDNDEDIYCIRVADIDSLTYGISENKLTIRNIETSDQEGRLLNTGDLIIEKSGGGDVSPVGRVVIYNLPYKAVTSNFMARLNISMEINNEFLYYIFSYLYSGRRNVPSIKATTGIQNLDLYSYLQNKVLVPPLEEQKQIVSHIKTETATIDTAIAKAEREIELIREYKEAMIAEAVMGKMKL
ncbi:MAG: Type-1 restriction enzyme EcoKI specificity protein [Bacteroidetes bacterium ADurb.Bin057]|nr:MAG: Type-1 restriction enzyme EcoKI specificity protein [Bacteroidetes bacterium ADurb.Bin057]